MPAANLRAQYGGIDGTVGSIVSLVAQASIALAGLVLVFLLLFGGFKMIQGAGENDPRKTGQGKQALTAAIGGFLLVFSAYWVIRALEVILGVRFLTGGL